MEQFSKISDILLDAVVDKKNYSASIKKATAFGFWGDICGARFSEFSKAYDIKGNTLFVAVKNPQVMQELIFNRNKILEKIKNYFLPLNIVIDDIRYNYKVWNNLNSTVELKGDEMPFNYANEEIEDIKLTELEEKELSKVTNTISNLSFLDDAAKKRYSKNIINSIKAKKLRQNGD